MELAELMAALSRPEAYPFPVASVEVRQTHISAVFIARERVYKLKKPVNLGFVDYSTPERRLHFCREEVRLNRRLAPSVYLGVVPVTRDGGTLRVGGTGEPVEWAVEMVRLPDAARLRDRLARGEVTAGVIEAVAARIAAFHRSAEGGERVAAFGRFGVVAGNAEENFAQTAGHVGTTVRPAVYERVRELTRSALDRLRPLIESRADRGVPRDGHGDLHLDHVYLFPDRPPPDDIVVVDCVEFAERFRCADPVADAAFLAMDLAHGDRRDLARVFADAYLRAAGDDEGHELLPFYAAYRAVVRAKVGGMKAAEPEVPPGERGRARADAARHWLLALSLLEDPARRPCLVLVGGLPGTGKSTLARELAAQLGFDVIRSDVVRKELAGLRPEESGRTAFGGGVYTPAWTERTYAECLRRAGELIAEGRRVVVDASFAADAHRERFLAAAREWGVPALLVVCTADPEVVRERVARRRGDASDADWAVHAELAGRWEPPGPTSSAALLRVDTSADPPAARVEDALRRLGPW